VMKKHKEHTSKLKRIGFDVKERNSQYRKLRNKARGILVKAKLVDDFLNINMKGRLKDETQ